MFCGSLLCATKTEEVAFRVGWRCLVRTGAAYKLGRRAAAGEGGQGLGEGGQVTAAGGVGGSGVVLLV